MSDIENDIIKEFLVESFENFSNISEELINLEKQGFDRDIINDIYRKVHTVKGSAAFLNFKNIENLTHTAEGLLDLIREEKVKLTAELMDKLLEAFDLCQALLKVVESSSKDEGVEVSSCVQGLMKIIEISASEKDVEQIKKSINPDLLKTTSKEEDVSVEKLEEKLEEIGDNKLVSDNSKSPKV